MTVDKNELEKLITASGVSSRTAKKLRDANGTGQTEASTTPRSPRGHGAPVDRTPASAL